MYTTKREEYWGLGGSVNGTGRRPRCVAYSVFNPQGRRCQVFNVTRVNPEDMAKSKAEAAAKQLTELYC